jgi:hypothetical protein
LGTATSIIAEEKELSDSARQRAEWLESTPVFDRIPAPGAVNQDTAHCFRGGAKQMRPVFKSSAVSKA